MFLFIAYGNVLALGFIELGDIMPSPGLNIIMHGLIIII